jgi:hypothetical protein
LRSVLVAGALLCAMNGTPVAAEQSCETLRTSKARVYGFHPAQMSETEIATKGKEIENFWKQVQSAGPEGVNCLREMLTAEKSDHIFQFDAASTLYQLDSSPDSLELVRNAAAQADFQETDPADYLSLAVALAESGVDIQPLAARLLRYPNATIHISEHSIDLDTDTAALLLYGNMPASQASKALATDLSAPEPFVRAAAAHLLAEQLTEESYRALSRWDGISKIEEEYRRNDIDAVMNYQAPDPATFANPKWSREQVLQIIAALPHTRKEFDEVSNGRGAEFDKQMKKNKVSQEDLAKAVEMGEPLYGLAGHSAFITSAAATLKAEDFETLREARRKALYNVSDESLEDYLTFTQLMIRLINRLDLYREYRVH